MDNKDRPGLSSLSIIQDIINILPYFVILVDAKHKIILANENAQNMIGERNDKLIGCYCPEIIHGLNEPFPGCPLEEAIETGNYVEKDLLDTFYNKWVSSAIYPTDIKAKSGERIYLHIVRDITDRKSAEEHLRRIKDSLEDNKKNLEETNIALKILLKNQEEEKRNIEINILKNIETLIVPYLDKLKHTLLTEQQKTLLAIAEINLTEIVKPFVIKFKNKDLNLSPTEIQIAKMVKEGKTAKEIAGIMCISENTVREFNSRIRKKLGIKRKKINLRAHLQSFFD